MNRNDQQFAAQRIREQYVEKQNTELDRLRALDIKVKRPAATLAYVLGSIGEMPRSPRQTLVLRLPKPAPTPLKNNPTCGKLGFVGDFMARAAKRQESFCGAFFQKATSLPAGAAFLLLAFLCASNAKEKRQTPSSCKAATPCNS